MAVSGWIRPMWEWAAKYCKFQLRIWVWLQCTVITVNALSVLETDFCFKHAGGLTFAGEIFSAIFWLPEKFTGNQKIA